MRQIAGLFLSKVPIPVSMIERFLVLIHSDNTTDIYVNDFAELAKMRVNRDVAAGEPVFAEDLSDIAEVRFPDIEINRDDAIVYAIRTEWRFSLYFDFSRSVDVDGLATDLGTLKREAIFYIQRATIDAKVARLRFDDAQAVVIPEGKSDVKHLLSAARVLDVVYDINFLEHDKAIGADVLYTMCEHFSLVPQPRPLIFLFDRDRNDIVKKLIPRDPSGAGYQEWGNNVYSMYLPIPSIRSDDTHAISIEFLYSDDDLRRRNRDGRRFFLSTEFHKKTGRHVSEDVHMTLPGRLKDRVTIIDSEVFDRTNNSVALSKDAFAEAILSEEEGFKDIDRSSFRPIFDTIGRIVAKASSQRILHDRHWRPDHHPA